MKQKSRIELFLELSAILTGFSETELKATGMLENYYNTILKNTGKEAIEYFFIDLGDLLNVSRTADRIEAIVGSQFMPASSYEGLAGNIIILWYTGNWNGNVVSAESYIQGLMWDASHTHPPGAKQPGFGSWANLPLSIQKTTLKKDTNGKKQL